MTIKQQIYNKLNDLSICEWDDLETVADIRELIDKLFEPNEPRIILSDEWIEPIIY
jgi:hypothetical protein